MDIVMCKITFRGIDWLCTSKAPASQRKKKEPNGKELTFGKIVKFGFFGFPFHNEEDFCIFIFFFRIFNCPYLVRRTSRRVSFHCLVSKFCLA